MVHWHPDELEQASEAGAGDCAAPDAAPRTTPLTGRATEVSLLKDRWEQAQEGMGQVVLVIGEPGLGKSRLVETIKKHVGAQSDPPPGTAAGSPAIVEWRCSPDSQSSGLFPVAECLRSLLGFAREDSTAARFDRLASHLDECGLGEQGFVALFAKLLFLPPDERYPAPGLTPVREREETFAALRQWLKRHSERKPLLFVVEDLHWIDASTLEFLTQFIAEGLHDRILTVLTFRPEFKTPWPAVAHQTSLALNRLTRKQVTELIERRAERHLPESLVAQIFDRTRGVPLLVEEFTRIVCESMELDSRSAPGKGMAAGQLADVPATLQDLMLARLDRLAIPRTFAQLAATLGREFHFELLAAVSELQAPACERELEKLVEAEILHVKGRPPQCIYSFKHALLEEALRTAPGAHERRRFHEQVATILEARFPEARERLPELLAQHFTEAGRSERAIPYWLQAGLNSRERFANLEAISHFTAGLKLLGELEPSPARDARELEFLGPLGTCYIASRGYAAPEVGPLFERARTLCERNGQTPQLFTMLWGTFAFHVVRGNFRLCADLAEDAVRMGEGLNDAGILMEALFLRGLTKFYRGDFAGAREHFATALERYDDRARTAEWAARIGEDVGVTTRCYLALSLWHLGYADQARLLSSETVALAREINQPFSLEYALHHAAWLWQQCRQGAPTEAAATEQIQMAREQGFSFWLATGMLFQSAGLLLQGHSGAGLDLLRRGLEAYRHTGAGLALPHYLGILAEACLKAGRYAEAHEALDEALALVARNDDHFQEAELLRLQGELMLAETGDTAVAEASFQRAIEVARRQKSVAWELRATISLARLQKQTNARAVQHALKTVYEQFTEGFNTPDLIEAAALLKELDNDCLRKDFAAGFDYVLNCLPSPLTGRVMADFRYLPSSTLGGDTLGYHWIDGDHLALYLIDVTGHGLDSALLSVSVNNVVRSGTVAGADPRRPEQVLAGLNSTFQGQRHGNKFFTIWYGVYQASRGTLTWSGGGHHPAVLLAPGELEAILLPSTGPMMGVLPDATFPWRSCRVPPGTRLLIFSDGVFEIRRNQAAVWDFASCVRLLASLDHSAAPLMDALMRHARQLRGAQHLDDDFSIIEARFW